MSSLCLARDLSHSISLLAVFLNRQTFSPLVSVSRSERSPDILSVTRVVCATCIGAGHELLANHKFPLVLIDGISSLVSRLSLLSDP